MTFSDDEHWEGTCDKCNRDKPVRYFHGNGQDTWDFYLCDRCLENFFNKLAPQDLSLYKHKTEGPDDMSAHIRSALTCTHLSIPIVDNKLELGTWQGIFLFEHRNKTYRRTVQLHIIGE